jgi:peptidoglycan/LPS O-acetylase OafA/YrhL
MNVEASESGPTHKRQQVLSSSVRPTDIPSLTGLRGLAAWLVVLAHTSSYFTADLPAVLEYGIRVGANLGMTIFFVLSGFVIHYNYGGSIRSEGAPAVRAFLNARFARLYPLYALALLVLIALFPFVLNEEAFAIWVWRYLTMTQDWTPTLVDGKLLATIYLGSAWSFVVKKNWVCRGRARLRFNCRRRDRCRLRWRPLV